ncbi:MAG TPA: DUF885 domain-containing protein [Actinomycetota bacterium]|nr:DUF885 domain-containing protein [Actinomycetota bacterium]
MDDARRASALAARFWDELLEDAPLLGTVVGDERWDDRLPDPSETGRARRETRSRAALAELATVDRAALDEDARTTLDVLEAIAARDVAEIEHRVDFLQIVSHLWGPAQLLAEIGSYQRADTPERLERLLARLEGTPAFYSASSEVAREGVAAGVTAPRVVVERTVAQVERLLAAPVEESPALEPVPRDDTQGRERVARTVRDAVVPALASYLETLRMYLPSATETIGLSALPGGEGMYAAQILGFTTLPLDPGEVHELGLADLEKIQEERRRSAEALGHPDAPAAIAALDASGRNTASSREELVRLAETQVAKGWEAAPRFFGRMPSANCEVRAVEPFREKDMPFAFYNPPSDDGSRPGVYYVNAYDLPSKPLHHLATTTYHEANPGHHFQTALEQEMGDRPALRRFGGYLAGAAFSEGWGLYCERLADEMGLFEDEAERLGMLDAQGMRAARLIVDTGIHAFGWARERAIAKLEEAGVPHVDAVIETDRYITMPGQALSYKIGQFEIEARREETERRDGAAFSLRDFHDQVLALGTLPLPAFRRELGA